MEPIRKRTLAVLLIGALIIQLTPIKATQPNYADCMRNPFATGCRGISAKRSGSSASSTGESVQARQPLSEAASITIQAEPMLLNNVPMWQSMAPPRLSQWPRQPVLAELMARHMLNFGYSQPAARWWPSTSESGAVELCRLNPIQPASIGSRNE